MELDSVLYKKIQKTKKKNIWSTVILASLNETKEAPYNI